MMKVSLGTDRGSGAAWSAAFGRNRDGECFLVIYVNELAVSTTYDHQSPPVDEGELKRWAADAIHARAASWTPSSR